MSKNALSFSLCVGEMEKFILYQDPYIDMSQNLIHWSLAWGLSFHTIWFKSVTNILRYPADTHTESTHTHTHTRSITLPRNFVGRVKEIYVI